MDHAIYQLLSIVPTDMCLHQYCWFRIFMNDITDHFVKFFMIFFQSTEFIIEFNSYQ